ncbi:MAG: sigma factor [Mycobacteriales bacterium]
MRDAAVRDSYVDFVAAAYPALLRYAYLLTGNLDSARELTQTALTRVWPRWGTLREPAAAGAYVRRVMASGLASAGRRHLVAQVPWTGLRSRPARIRALHWRPEPTCGPPSNPYRRGSGP